MNEQAGGNSRWGRERNHRLSVGGALRPCPGPKATYVRELFEELGVLKDGVWDERYLCFAPQERLFLYGRWQEGIEPAVGLSDKDRDQFRRLEELIHSFAQPAGSRSRWSNGLSRENPASTGCRSATGCAAERWIRGFSAGT